MLNGDAETGVSIMQMDEGLDTGDVLACEKIVIDPEETSGQLFDRVTAVGARVLCETLPAIEAGTLKAEPQAHENASVAPMLSKEMAEFHLTDSAEHIHNWVRGMNPWPGAWFVTAGGKKVKVMESRVAESHGEAAGTVLATKPLTVACGEGAIQLLHVVPEGKKPMDGTSFAAGLRLKAGAEPEYYPADHISYHPDRCVCDDAVHQCVDDSGCPSDPSAVHAYHQFRYEALPEIFPGTAEVSG